MASTINAKNTSTGLVITPDASGQLELQTADTTRMTIDVNGNVGVGTTSPLTKLNTSVGVIPASTITSGLTLTATYGTVTSVNSIDFNYTGQTTYPVRLGAIFNTDGLGMELIAYTSPSYLSNGTERLRINKDGYVFNAVNGLGNGLHNAYQYYRLNAGVAGANATGAQSVFGVGVTLVGSTVYEFEMLMVLSKTAGTTSHTMSLGFGGTATVNNIAYNLVYTDGALVTLGTRTGILFIQTASATAITTAMSSASNSVFGVIKGTVSVNAGGTFIPQYTLSAAPGGAYTTQAGSYIKISPLSASGSNTSIGSWA